MTQFEQIHLDWAFEKRYRKKIALLAIQKSPTGARKASQCLAPVDADKYSEAWASPHAIRGDGALD
jgi:hypothetical protein